MRTTRSIAGRPRPAIRAALLGIGSSLLAAGGALVAALCASPASRGADAAMSRWLDVESRIEYAYYTEDRRGLESIATSLAASTAGADGERRYYLALASYRMAQLADPGRTGRIKRSAERCVSSLDADSGAEPIAAERLALQSACLRLLAALEPLRSPYLGLKSGSAMRRALELAPLETRVLLLHALADRDARGDAARVTSELRQAIAAFELERKGVEHVPEWGAAEAYASLGRSLLEQGRALAARGALEHALLLVPDFALAHRLMAHITSG